MAEDKRAYLRPEVKEIGLACFAGILAGAGSGGFENPEVDGGFPGDDE